MLLLLRRLSKLKRAKQASATKPLARIPPSIVQTVSGQSPDHTPPAPRPDPPKLGSDCPATAAAGKETQQDFPFSQVLRRTQGRRKWAAVSVAVRGVLKMAARNVLAAVAGCPRHSPLWLSTGQLLSTHVKRSDRRVLPHTELTHGQLGICVSPQLLLPLTPFDTINGSPHDTPSTEFG